MPAPIEPSPAQMRALRRRDPVLAAAAKRVEAYPGFPHAMQSRLSYFAYLARSIVFQQLAGAAATTIWKRVVALTPGSRLALPAELLRMPEEKLRGAGLSRNKMASVLDLAGRVESGELRLRSIARLDDEAAIEELVQVRGIGPWTAQMFLLFRLGRLDILAPADLGLQEGMRILDGLDERPTAKELEARGEAWAPLRSVASWVLWRLTDQTGDS